MNKFYYNGISKKYQSELDPEINKMGSEISKYFQKSWMKDIRDKISFHNDKKTILERFGNLKDDEVIDCYLSEEGRGHSLYQTALSIRHEQALNLIMEKKGITGKDYKPAIEILVDETEQITGTFIKFLEGWITKFFEYHKLQPDFQKVENSPMPSSMGVNIPYFIKTGREK